MREEPAPVGRRVALFVQGSLQFAVVVGVAQWVPPDGVAVPLSWGLLLFPVGLNAVGSMVSGLAFRARSSVERATRLSRGLTIAATFVVLPALALFLDGSSISLARPASVAVALTLVVVLAVPGVLFAVGLVLDDERSRLLFLVGISCFWTPLFGGFAVGLAVGLPYYWLVATPVTAAKAVGALLVGLFGGSLAPVALAPAWLTYREYRGREASLSDALPW